MRAKRVAERRARPPKPTDKSPTIGRVQRVLVLGAGFGGLELATMLSEALGDDVDVDADRQERRVRLRVLEARRDVRADDARRGAPAVPRASRSRACASAGDGHRDRPEARRVTTDAGVHEADVLVVALGADYDVDATPGLAEAGNEFYSVAGAERLAERAARRSRAAARSIGVCGAPVQVPAGAERVRAAAARLAVGAGRPRRCEISFVIPFGTPVPPSPETSAALVAAFAERDIEFVPGRRVALARRRPRRRRARRRQRAAVRPLPRRAEAPRARRRHRERHDRGRLRARRARSTLETRFPGVYAVGDVATVGVPKAGVFAEGAARVVAASLIAALRGGEQPAAYDGRGSCYIEFGAGRVGRVDVDFLSGPKPTGTFQRAVGRALVAEKHRLRLEPTRALVRTLSSLRYREPMLVTHGRGGEGLDKREDPRRLYRRW